MSTSRSRVSATSDRSPVGVQGQEVSLKGRVPTFWAKSRAITKTLEVTGVETVVSELEVPAVKAVKDDEVLGQEVVRVILNYPYCMMWDFVQVSVTGGIVTLMGSVTPGLDEGRRPLRACGQGSRRTRRADDD